jgi:hypothetical protein
MKFPSGAATRSIALVLTLTVAACGGDAVQGAPSADAGPVPGAGPSPDAGPSPGSAPDASALPDALGTKTPMPADARPADGTVAPAPGNCGDIAPDRSHPPFEAIKRLATTSEPVRILVYGQSISEQVWWSQVRDWLKTQYPRGNLIMEQHAHGGCASQCLIGREAWTVDGTTRNRVLEDVFAWKPDLVIFNVYGRHDDYEYLVKSFRQGCAALDDHPVAAVHCPPGMRFPDYKPAEVLLQTYHRVSDTDFHDSLPAEPPVPDADWDYWMATTWIPAVARRQNAFVAPIWGPWWDYLQTHKLHAAALLSDGEHLNDAGNALMARLTEPSLCYAP